MHELTIVTTTEMRFEDVVDVSLGCILQTEPLRFQTLRFETFFNDFVAGGRSAASIYGIVGYSIIAFMAIKHDVLCWCGG